MPAGDIEITVEERGDVHVVACVGELDVATAPTLRDTLAELAPGHVLIDLCDTTFLDSTALSTLLNAARRRTRAGFRLAIACPPSDVRDVFRMTQLVETLRVGEDRDGALALLTR